VPVQPTAPQLFRDDHVRVLREKPAQPPGHGVPEGEWFEGLLEGGGDAESWPWAS
jgi:hypothetical protein